MLFDFFLESHALLPTPSRQGSPLGILSPAAQDVVLGRRSASNLRGLPVFGNPSLTGGAGPAVGEGSELIR